MAEGGRTRSEVDGSIGYRSQTSRVMNRPSARDTVPEEDRIAMFPSEVKRRITVGVNDPGPQLEGDSLDRGSEFSARSPFLQWCRLRLSRISRLLQSQSEHSRWGR